MIKYVITILTFSIVIANAAVTGYLLNQTKTDQLNSAIATQIIANTFVALNENDKTFIKEFKTTNENNKGLGIAINNLSTEIGELNQNQTVITEDLIIMKAELVTLKAAIAAKSSGKTK